MASDYAHRPVLLEETLSYLNCSQGSIVVDGTVGGGGHSEAILSATAPDGLVIGLDLDRDALDATATRLASVGDRVRLVPASFRDLGSVLAELEVDAIDALLLDLGVSSYQLDTPARGFRFSGGPEQTRETPLDMRMDPTRGESAATLLARSTAEQLQKIFQNYGELPGSKRLARAIVETRRQKPLQTAADLLEVIREARVGGGRRHHPATRVFQALRIAVNDELGALREGLDAAIDALRPGGRIVVIAYHSLEDRVVKNLFRDAARGCTCPPRMPVCICGGAVSLRVLTRKPVEASPEETRANPRARSARLRAASRVEPAGASS